MIIYLLFGVNMVVDLIKEILYRIRWICIVQLLGIIQDVSLFYTKDILTMVKLLMILVIIHLYLIQEFMKNIKYFFLILLLTYLILKIPLVLIITKEKK